MKKLVLFISSIVTAILLYLETKKIKMTYYTIESEKVAGDDIKIIFLSDLHSYEYGKNNAKILKAIDREKPDVIICSGDMIVSENMEKSDITIELFQKLACKYKVYYANGNHEYRMKINKEKYGETYENFKDELIATGTVLLENECECICINDTVINIFGLEIDNKFYKRFKKTKMEKGYVDGLIGECDENILNFLIAHNPEYTENYVEWGADIVFSGHLHGGVLRLPVLGGVISPQFFILPKYSGDLYKIGEKYSVVSKGMGAHTIPIRIFNRAEIVSINLKEKTH